MSDVTVRNCGAYGMMDKISKIIKRDHAFKLLVYDIFNEEFPDDDEITSSLNMEQIIELMNNDSNFKKLVLQLIKDHFPE